MSFSERIFQILNRVTVLAFLIVAIALFVMIWQSISLNFARADLIETQEFGTLREELDEDFSGDEIETADGTVVVYQYSSKQKLDNLYYDQASDVTLVNSVTGEQRKISGDDRKVISFHKVMRPIEEAGEDGETKVRSVAFAYVARLATREMYLEGKADLVVGNLATFRQAQIAEGVPFVDTVSRGPEEGQISVLYWDSPKSARHVVISAETLEILSAQAVELPSVESFQLDKLSEQLEAREDAVDEAVEAAADEAAQERAKRRAKREQNQ